MLTHNALPAEPPWFTFTGPDYDVVIATVMTLVRNVEDFPFRESMTRDDNLQFRKRVEQAFTGLPGEYVFLDGDAMRPERVRFHHRRGYFPTPEPGAFSILSRDGTTVISLGDDDHLVLSSFAGGWNGTEALSRVRALDQALEEHLSWAVSLRLGYLSPRVDAAGTGLVAEAVLFLPALSKGGVSVESVVAADEALRNRIEVRPELPGGRESDAAQSTALFRCCCPARFPEKEEETLSVLEECVGRLVHYEREARRAVEAAHPLDMADAAHRALGTLHHAVKLTGDEAVASAVLVRMAVASGMMGGPELARVTELLFSMDDESVDFLHTTGGPDDASGDVRRALLIREILSDRDQRQESSDV